MTGSPSAAVPALDVERLVVDYAAMRHGRRRARRAGAGFMPAHAVDGVSLHVGVGEFVGLVGESGSGKSSLVNAIMGLAPISSGEVRLAGAALAGCSARAARRARRAAQLIMQDPYEALDPHMTIRRIVEEPLIVHRLERDRTRRRARVAQALEAVGLTPATDFLDRRPHELSGGQRQRIAIAACLIVDPALVLADEPVSMLDVSVRAGILHMLDALRRERTAAVLMITHDLPTAAAFCDRLVVMSRGRIVEQGTPEQITRNPAEAYTRALLAATPSLRRDA